MLELVSLAMLKAIEIAVLNAMLVAVSIAVLNAMLEAFLFGILKFSSVVPVAPGRALSCEFRRGGKLATNIYLSTPIAEAIWGTKIDLFWSKASCNPNGNYKCTTR